MKQEHKELLLKDLCSRLPYGVKIKTSYGNIEEPIELKSVNPKGETFTVGGRFTAVSGLKLDLDDCKPYLFPIASMNEEQKKELDRMFEMDMDVAVNCISNGISNIVSGLNRLDWIIAHHFDYRGLIEKGLAIDVTNLNVYSKEE